MTMYNIKGIALKNENTVHVHSPTCHSEQRRSEFEECTGFFFYAITMNKGYKSTIKKKVIHRTCTLFQFFWSHMIDLYEEQTEIEVFSSSEIWPFLWINRY